MILADLFEDAPFNGRIEHPDQRELAFGNSPHAANTEAPDEEEIDYAGCWEEILEYPDEDSSTSVEEQIARAIQAMKASATKIELYGIEDEVYIIGDKIVFLDDQDATVEDKYAWIEEIDPEDFFPGYDEKWNNDFWSGPCPLYHATTEENVKGILKRGIYASSATRGLSNRSVGAAVFTTSDVDETAEGSYGSFVFEIDTRALAKDPNRPFASEEPPVVESTLREALAHKIGLEEYYSEVESGISPYTVILHGSVGPQYITLLD